MGLLRCPMSLGFREMFYILFGLGFDFRAFFDGFWPCQKVL